MANEVGLNRAARLSNFFQEIRIKIVCTVTRNELLNLFYFTGMPQPVSSISCTIHLYNTVNKAEDSISKSVLRTSSLRRCNKLSDFTETIPGKYNIIEFTTLKTRLNVNKPLAMA